MISKPLRFNPTLFAVLGSFRQRVTPRLLIGLGTVGLLLVSIPIAKTRLASSAEATTTQPERILPVETLTATPVSSYEVWRTYTGEIASLRASELGFERSGQLVAVLVDEGDFVQAGAPLARLDIRNIQTQRQQLVAEKARAAAQLLELQIGARAEDMAAALAVVRDLEQQLRLEQVRLARRESLYAQGAISREELDQVVFGRGSLQARLDQARSEFEELQNGTRPEQIAAQQALVQQLQAGIVDLEVTLAKSTLRAPFDGIVSIRQVDEGTVVAAGQSVLRLMENATPEARVGMPVSAVSQLEIGDKKTVYLANQAYPATVASILPEVDPQTRTQMVVMPLTSSTTAQVSPGQTVRVKLRESISTEGVWLPTEALTQGIRGLWTCYVLTPQENTGEEIYTVQLQSVEILHQAGDRVLVRGTLQPNDVIVANGVHRLVPGQLVRPIEQVSRLARSN